MPLRRLYNYIGLIMLYFNFNIILDLNNFFSCKAIYQSLPGFQLTLENSWNMASMACKHAQSWRWCLSALGLVQNDVMQAYPDAKVN
jgi:hypothetical protein